MTAFSLRGFSLFLMLTLCPAWVARAQTGGGSVSLSGVVSETIALSISQESGAAGVLVSTSRNAERSLTVTISGTTRDTAELRISVQIRSNTAYGLFASAKNGGANLSSLLVVGARPTGIFVAPDAAEALSVAAAFDGRGGAGGSTHAAGFNRTNLSALSELLSGPRVSTGGTLHSPQNALEVVLSMTVEPRADDQSWTVELLLSAAPGGQLP